jgi:hypothetical protein
LAREPEVLGENLPQCRFVHHKTHMLPGHEPGPPRWEASDYRILAGTPTVMTEVLAVSLSHYRKIPGQYLDYAAIAFVQILSNLSFISPIMNAHENPVSSREIHVERSDTGASFSVSFFGF